MTAACSVPALCTCDRFSATAQIGLRASLDSVGWQPKARGSGVCDWQDSFPHFNSDEERWPRPYAEFVSGYLPVKPHYNRLCTCSAVAELDFKEVKRQLKGEGISAFVGGRC